MASSQAGAFAPPPLRIVGTIEFDIDQSRGGEWYGTWLKSGRRGVERVGIVPEEERHPVQAVVPAAPVAEEDSSSEYGDEGDAISDTGSGYVPLSEDDGDNSTRETSEEPKDDSEGDNELAAGADPLGDVFPSDEQEWNDIRSARDEAAEDEDEQKGLGIRSSRAGRESLILSGAELSRGLDEDLPDDFEDAADLDRKEIEELLARHPPAPGYGNASSGENTPISSADRSSTPGRSTRRNTALSNPLNLTLASPITLADSPTPNTLPVLTTSPTSSEVHGTRGAPRQSDDSLLSPTSEFSGGLAYLRGNSMDEVSMASGSSLDGGMSAAFYGAFGVGEHGEILGNEDGNRGSAYMMHESLNDLEKGEFASNPRKNLTSSD